MLFEIWEKKRARKHPPRLPKYLNKKGGIRRLSSLISYPSIDRESSTLFFTYAE